MKNKIKILIITALCAIFTIVTYMNIEQYLLKNKYEVTSKRVHDYSQCLLTDALSSKNVSEICSSKLFNFSLNHYEKGIRYSNILCNNDFIESCDDLNFLNSSWSNLTNNLNKNKTRPLKNCLHEYNEDCEDWIEIANVVGDNDLNAYLQGESCINNFYENTKNKSVLTKCFKKIKPFKAFSVNTNLEFYNELCVKPCGANELCLSKDECKNINTTLQLQAIFTPSNYTEGLGTVDKNLLLESYIEKKPTATKLEKICKENKIICSEYFNNSLIQYSVVESELTLDENKIIDSNNLRFFLDSYTPIPNKISSISKLWTESYRLNRSKKIEELALTAINTFSNKSAEEKRKYKSNYISEFRFNSNYDSSFYKELEKTSLFKLIDKLYFEPVDSYTPEINERMKKYFCNDPFQSQHCSFIFKNVKEAKNNKSLLENFCKKGDNLSCEIIKIDNGANALFSPSNFITALKYSYKREVKNSYGSLITTFIFENVKVLVLFFFIIISFLVLFLTYTYFSHVELINYLKNSWKKDGDKKANAILSKLNKDNKKSD